MFFFITNNTFLVKRCTAFGMVGLVKGQLLKYSFIVVFNDLKGCKLTKTKYDILFYKKTNFIYLFVTCKTFLWSFPVSFWQHAVSSYIN